MTNREKAEAQKKKALELLWNKPVNSTLVERWFLLDRACEKYENEPQPLAMGKGLMDILGHASLPIDPCDLLLGRYVDRVPTEEEERRLTEIWDRRVHHRNPITTVNCGHLTLDWETLVQIGIPGYIKKAEQRIEQAKRDGAEQKRLDFLEGMRLSYAAIHLYIDRYGKAAMAAGESELADVCRRLTTGKPTTFREALQLVLFVFTVYLIYAGWRVACLTLGRMDQYLLPFYLRDLESGRATREEIACLIDDFQCKTSLHLGRGEHQMANPAFGGNTTGWARNPVFDSPTYIVIGGNRKDGEPENPLTRLFAESIVPGLKNPVYIYRWNRQRSDSVWNTICDRIRKNASVLVYNDETMIPAMRRIGVSESDAMNYTVHPCNWPDISGGYVALDKIGDPIPVMLYHVLYDDNGSGRDFCSMEKIYTAFSAYYRNVLEKSISGIRAKYFFDQSPFSSRLNLDDCFLPGPMESLCSSMDGGVKYPAVYMLIRNIGTAADMMSAIEELVFRTHRFTLHELLDAAAHNFDGYGEVLAACRRAPKYGTDQDGADQHAIRLMNTMLDLIDCATKVQSGERRLYPLCVTITDMEHILNGKNLPATPDGRLAGEPLSENLSPTVGYYESVTALLNSVSKLPFDRIHSGVLNVRLCGNLIDGEAGLARLQALMDTYFENGGIQMQVSVADTDTLRAAQKNPDAYRDLRVRITGYSAVFVDMSKNGQDEIIRRDEVN